MAHDAWHELIHLSAAVVLWGGGGVILFRQWRARAVGDGAPPASGADPVPAALTILSVALAIAIAAIHLAAAPSHIEDLGVLGWGFVLAAVLGGSWALAYGIEPSDRIAWAGIAIHGAVLAAWLASRTIGLPTGSLAGTPEPVAMPDATATIFGILLVGVLVGRIGDLDDLVREAVRGAPSAVAIAIVPTVGIVFLAATLAVSLALGHSHAPGAGHDTVEHAPAPVVPADAP